MKSVGKKEVTMADAIFDSVGKLHIDLDAEERGYITRMLRSSLGLYEEEALHIYEVRHFVYEQFNRRVADSRTVATLSQRFNMSIRGHNKEIAKDVETYIKQAFHAEREDDPDGAAYYLKKAQLRNTVLHSPEVKDHCKRLKDTNKYAEQAWFQLNMIEFCRDKLFRSVIKMAAELAHKHRRVLKGNVTAKADLIQEAILAAKQYVEMYQPTDDGATYTSYMYSSIDHHLSRYMSENTRTVALPRTVLDRYRPIAYAIERVGMTNVSDLALMSTKILHDLKQKSSGRKLERQEAYTADEVASLLTYVQASASIDVVLNIEEPSTGTSFMGYSEIADPKPIQDEKHDEVNGMRLLLGVIEEYCTTVEEYKLMEVRWGQHRVRGLKTTADVYRRTTGRPMNKGKVAELERKVLNRVKKGIANGDARLKEIKQTLETLL